MKYVFLYSYLRNNTIFYFFFFFFPRPLTQVNLPQDLTYITPQGISSVSMNL